MAKRFLLILFLSLFSWVTLAAPINKNASKYAYLINIAGKQRMLTQRIAKSYFFYSMRVRPDRVHLQMMESIYEFEQNYQILRKEVPLQDVQDMLAYISMTQKEFIELVKLPFNLERGAKVIDYSESLLEASQDIVETLEDAANMHTSEIIDIAGRQRMLAQRIAKFYIAYQAGLKNPYIVGEIKKAIAEFEDAQSELLRFQGNNPQIRMELTKVSNLWRTVSKFYKNVERRPLPVIILTTTDKITEVMDRVTHLYVQTLKA